MKSLPTCPNCKKQNRLVLTDNATITCTRDAGGCGSHFSISKIAEMYPQESSDPTAAAIVPYCQETGQHRFVGPSAHSSKRFCAYCGEVEKCICNPCSKFVASECQAAIHRTTPKKTVETTAKRV